MDSDIPCKLCGEGGHKPSKCPELSQPEKTSGGGGGDDHDHDQLFVYVNVAVTYAKKVHV
jgi:hypothetical protein